MDPYLEAHWPDVHTSLAIDARNALNRKLPSDLIACVEERVEIESESQEGRTLAPDVLIVERPASETSVGEEVGGGVMTAPLRLLAQMEPVTERFIKIIEPGTERLVTVIEFISPSNKRGAGMQAFRSKRAELLASGVNFVEVDLVRAGDWRALLAPHRHRRNPTLYRVAIRVPKDPAAVYLFPIRLQDRLPEIDIPLRATDPQLKLELQPLLDQAYMNGRYHQRIDYRSPLDPPLEGEDAAFAASLMKAK